MTTGVTAPLGFRAAAVASGIKPGRPGPRADRRRRPAAPRPASVHDQPRAGGAGRRLARAPGVGPRPGHRGQRRLRERRHRRRRPRGRARDGRDRRRQRRLRGRRGPRGLDRRHRRAAADGERARRGSPRPARRISRHAGAEAARAILTTDTKPKEVAVEFSSGDETCVVGGMAKGAGMIAPNMATMLAFFTTDAAVAPALLRRALADAVGESLNRITVDGDTSTNDCAIVARERRAQRAARSRATVPRSRPSAAALDAGRARGWPDAGARRRGRHAGGRVRRRGRAHDGRRRPHRAHDRRVAARQDGAARRRPELGPGARVRRPGRRPARHRRASRSGSATCPWPSAAPRSSTTRRRPPRRCSEDPVRLRVRLGEGEASGWLWTSDLSRGYVDINAHYRS